MKTGDIIKFGDYDWRVLKIENERALIITESIIERRKFNERRCDRCWGNCDLREYLNNDFLKKFNEQEKLRMILTQNRIGKNPMFDTPTGEQTEDYVFLLTLNDVLDLFGESFDTFMAAEFAPGHFHIISDENDCNRIAMHNGVECRWWLGSYGSSEEHIACVNPEGMIDFDGSFVDGDPFSQNGYGVRPALWLTM